MPEIVIAVIGALVAVGGAVNADRQSKKALRSQEKRNKKIDAQNAAQAASNRRKSLREARVRRAAVLAEAEASGTAESSTAISSSSLTGTQAAERIGSVSSSLAATNSISRSNQAIADSNARAQLFKNVSSIGSSVFQSAGGVGTIANSFTADK